jgi:hypothetical protein
VQLDAMFLQLGIAGAMLLVMYRIAMRWMANERERQEAVTKADIERNRASASAETERTKAIQDGFRADIEAHHAIALTMGALGNQFSRIEGKLDTILDLTPVRELYGVPTTTELRTRETREASVIVQSEFQNERRPPTNKTPPGGTPAITGGEYSRTKPVKR